MKHIIFICTGNTCRSPMAAALCSNLAAQRGLQLAVESMGLAACPGDPATPEAAAVLSEMGLDLSSHRARQAHPADLMSANRVVCMTRSHRTILEGAGIQPEKLRVLGVGIPDPFGGSLEDYRACRDAIAAALPALLDEWGAEP